MVVEPSISAGLGRGKLVGGVTGPLASESAAWAARASDARAIVRTDLTDGGCRWPALGTPKVRS